MDLLEAEVVLRSFGVDPNVPLSPEQERGLRSKPKARRLVHLALAILQSSTTDDVSQPEEV